MAFEIRGPRCPLKLEPAPRYARVTTENKRFQLFDQFALEHAVRTNCLNPLTREQIINGFAEGDTLIEIDGTDVRGMPTERVLVLLKAKRDSEFCHVHVLPRGPLASPFEKECVEKQLADDPYGRSYINIKTKALLDALENGTAELKNVTQSQYPGILPLGYGPQMTKVVEQLRSPTMRPADDWNTWIADEALAAMRELVSGGAYDRESFKAALRGVLGWDTIARDVLREDAGSTSYLEAKPFDAAHYDALWMLFRAASCELTPTVVLEAVRSTELLAAPTVMMETWQRAGNLRDCLLDSRAGEADIKRCVEALDPWLGHCIAFGETIGPIPGLQRTRRIIKRLFDPEDC